MTDPRPHRWSGWPGAHCLDCGCGEPAEDALADPAYDGWEGTWATPEAEAAWRARNQPGLEPCPGQVGEPAGPASS